MRSQVELDRLPFMYSLIVTQEMRGRESSNKTDVSTVTMCRVSMAIGLRSALVLAQETQIGDSTLWMLCGDCVHVFVMCVDCMLWPVHIRACGFVCIHLFDLRC